MSVIVRHNNDAIGVGQAARETGETVHRIWYAARKFPEIVLVKARGQQQQLVISRRLLLERLPTIGRYSKRRPPEPQRADGEVGHAAA